MEMKVYEIQNFNNNSPYRKRCGRAVRRMGYGAANTGGFYGNRLDHRRNHLAGSVREKSEKHSAYMLDDFHANAGRRNYTKYSRDVNNWGGDGLPGAAVVCYLPVLAGSEGFRCGYGAVTFLYGSE